MATSFLFEDVFDLVEVDVTRDPKDPSRKIKEKKFDLVSRIVARNENHETELTLDVQTQIYPMREGDRFRFVLTHSLEEQAATTIGSSGVAAPSTAVMRTYTEHDPPSLQDEFDYVMYGMVFKFVEDRGKAVVYASFGGLLMELRGEPRAIRSQMFEVDSRLYLLIKKI